MKIYWHSTAPWSPSSYSILTARTVPNIVRAGQDIILGTWYGLNGQPLPWQVKDRNGQTSHTVTVLPHHGDPYGADVMKFNYKYHNCNVCITCSDIWVFEPKYTHMMNYAPWFPVDYAPLPDSIAHSMEPAIYPMVFSRWGRDVIREAGLDAHYVPCSAPADLYTPGDKEEARNLFSVTRKYDFLVTVINANKDAQDRKGFAEALQGFAKFLETHPDSMLYCHTNWSGPINIAAMGKRLGISDYIIQPDQYAYNMGLLNEVYLRDVFRASDVLLNTCKSEGFGLPLVEAQMCGCPVIAPDYSTTDELMFAGWKMKGQPDWAFGADSWRYRVFVDEVTSALEEAYRQKGNRKLQRKARNGAKQYDNGRIFAKYWKPALTAIEGIIEKGRTVHAISETISERSSMVPVPG